MGVYASCKNSNDFNRGSLYIVHENDFKPNSMLLKSNFEACTPHIKFELKWTSNFDKTLYLLQVKEIWGFGNLKNDSLFSTV